jgi:hypothetical protein
MLEKPMMWKAGVTCRRTSPHQNGDLHGNDGRRTVMLGDDE